MVCLLSLFFHVLFFVSLYFLHDFEFSAPKPKVVTVDLVTFAPGPEPVDAGTPKKSVVPEEPVSSNADMVNPDAVSQVSPKPPQPAEPKELDIPIIKPEVSLKSKPDNIKELILARKIEPPEKKPVEKKKTPKKQAEKKQKQALAKTKKRQAAKLEKQRQAQLKNALARMKASVASKENNTQGNNSGDTGRTGVAGGTGVGDAGPLTMYQIMIKTAIEQNWIFNDAMAGLNQDLEVRIFIKILKSGDIRDISFETRSGNNYLDESAKKAVQKANPLPRLPKGMPSYELVLGFSPKGLN